MKILTILFTITLLMSTCHDSSNRYYSKSEEVSTVRLPITDNTEEYSEIKENDFFEAITTPLSTFSIDVDAASYSNTRRFITDGQLPPKDAVRIEEFINYFNYDYKQPKNNEPFSINTEISDCPWNPENKLLHIGLQGKTISQENLPKNNLVFLLDVSGSMNNPNKLPLLKKSFNLLLNSLDEDDRIAIVVYAGASGVVLPSTACSNKEKILESLNNLQAGGPTAGIDGINLAYKIAEENFIENENNRIILATDGDFNVGVSSDSELVKIIEKKRETGIFLSVLGFGTGNIKDSKMEKLADKGNGNFYYIDNLFEAKKVLVTEMGGTLFTIAKDVKIQIEFNPSNVYKYRLIGYENRLLNNEDFEDDTKDAGELGSGHTVTALYEIVVNKDNNSTTEVKYKYQTSKIKTEDNLKLEIATVKFRYKEPKATESKLIKTTILDEHHLLENASNNFIFSASVAEFGLMLRNSKYKTNSSYEQILSLAKKAKGKDENGYRSEFIKLVDMAKTLSENN